MIDLITKSSSYYDYIKITLQYIDITNSIGNINDICVLAYMMTLGSDEIHLSANNRKQMGEFLNTHPQTIINSIGYLKNADIISGGRGKYKLLKYNWICQKNPIRVTIIPRS
jgi:hypothetical protein